jgi:putative sterol carrier protein
MSAVIEAAIAALKDKIGDRGLDGSARMVIEGEGSIRIDESGITADDSDADVTMTADADTFRGMLDGDVNPTMAFMSGRLAISGDMGLAMKLGALLS